jgi:protocatechuate 3,4-dioxygenase beta subunit
MAIIIMTLALLLAFFLAAQDKAPEKCTVSGSVVNSMSGEPLSRVDIFAVPEGSGTLSTTTTDSKGNFTLVDLAPGQYKLEGNRNGFLDTYYGARRANSGGTLISLEPGVEMKDLQIELVPFAVLAGTVRENDGEPLSGAHVTVFAVTYDGGRRSIAQTTDAHTDDLGQYRISNLEPGKYYIRAEPHRDDEDEPNAAVPEDHSPKKAPREVLLPALYPGVVDPAAARPVEAAAGSRIMGLDIALPRSRVFRVTGHITAPAGTRAGVALKPARGFDELGQRHEGIVKPDGDFEIRGVPPGSYTVVATAAPPKKFTPGILIMNFGQNSYASMPLDMGEADIAGVRIAVAAGAEVEGRITVEGDPVSLNGFVNFLDDTGKGPSAAIMEGQVFTTLLSPGSYSVYAGGNTLAIKSIRAGQVDVLRDGLTVTEAGRISLELVLARDGGTIEGVVLDKDDKPVAGATVLLVPDAPLRGRHDRFADLATDQNGRYKFDNVAPGDYKVFAWDDIESDAWFDPDFFRYIESHGEPVKLNAKGQKTAKVHLPESK